MTFSRRANNDWLVDSSIQRANNDCTSIREKTAMQYVPTIGPFHSTTSQFTHHEYLQYTYISEMSAKVVFLNDWFSSIFNVPIPGMSYELTTAVVT